MWNITRNDAVYFFTYMYEIILQFLPIGMLIKIMHCNLSLSIKSWVQMTHVQLFWNYTCQVLLKFEMKDVWCLYIRMHLEYGLNVMALIYWGKHTNGNFVVISISILIVIPFEYHSRHMYHVQEYSDRICIAKKFF